MAGLSLLVALSNAIAKDNSAIENWGRDWAVIAGVFPVVLIALGLAYYLPFKHGRW